MRSESDMPPSTAAIAVRDMDVGYGTFVVQRNLDFEVARGKIFAIMGGSGSGKSSVLRVMITLLPPLRGDVLFGGVSLWQADDAERERLMRRFGVLYQGGALWSSMTLSENVALPLQEYVRAGAEEISAVSSLKLALVG